jgi:penicillin-binding protein 1A
MSGLFAFAAPAKGAPGPRRAPRKSAASGGGGKGGGKGRNSPRNGKTPKKGKKPRRWWVSLLRWCATLAVWGVIALVCIVAWFAHDLPPIDQMIDSTRRPSLTVQAADGTTLASYGDLYGEVVAVEEMPPWLPGAVVSIEDRRFYSHFGVDPLGIARAIYVNFRAGRMVQGGSTLTQQVVKNVFLTQERTLKRKVQEALLALWMEHKFTKNQILTLYLNRVYLGAGTYGVEAASQRYFGISARQVTPLQAALLAGLLKAPSRYSPASNPELAVSRASVVLQAMVETGVLTEQEAQHALAGGTALAGEARRPRPGRHFSDWVIEQVDEYIGSVSTDVIVKTTLDPRLQRTAEQALAATLAAEGGKLHASEGAVVVLTPDGAVRAMVGGRDYGASQFNRAVQALRQPGSSFKPFVYLAGLEAGLTPSDSVEDAPVTVNGWSPENFDHRYRGSMPLRDAVAQSINTVAVRVSEMAGRQRVIAVAHRLGLTADLQPTPSLALGTQETAVLPLVGAYAPFANGGTGVVPYGITEILTRDGQVLYRREGSGLGQVIKPKDLGAMNDMLSGVVDHGTGRRASFGRPAGGKTGTSADYRDAWFVGYTADFVAGVWIGNDNNSPMKRVTGGSLPAEIWKTVMIAAHQGLPARPLPGPPPEEDPMGSFIRSIFGSSDSQPTPAPTAPQPEPTLKPAGPQTHQDVLDLFDKN